MWHDWPDAEKVTCQTDFPFTLWTPTQRMSTYEREADHRLRLEVSGAPEFIQAGAAATAFSLKNQQAAAGPAAAAPHTLPQE
jgi:hypothetical protein